MTKEEKKYYDLLDAVQELFNELRITPTGLCAMSEGYSPSYPGQIIINNNCLLSIHEEDRRNVIHISKIVANKLIDAGVNDTE